MSRLGAVLCLSTIAVTMMVNEVASAQADAKFKGNYNFWSSMGWQQHAQNQARSLYYYGQTPNVSPQQAKEHATATRSAITASQKHLAELKKAHPDNKEAQASIAKIEAIHKKVLGHCDLCDTALAKANHPEMCGCCAKIVNDLHEANAEMSKLQKSLKISDEIPKH